MSGRPQVAVVIATYNREATIERAVRSALAQQGVTKQVVVVDDGSTDSTSRILSGFADAITAIRQPNRERGAARNVGVEATSARFVAFLDSDDELLPGHLAGLVGEFEGDDGAGLAYSRAVITGPHGETLWSTPEAPFEGEVLRELALENRLTLSAAMVRRATFEAVGRFDEDRRLAGAEDWELWVRMAAVARFRHRPETTVRMHIHGGNTVTDPLVMERAVTEAMRRILAHPRVRALDIERAVRARALRNLVRGYVDNGDAAKARRRVLNSVGARPELLLDRHVWRAVARATVGSLGGSRLERDVTGAARPEDVDGAQ